MTASRDPDRLIHKFLLEGEEEVQDRVYDAVRAEIEHKRQRVVIGPWRTPIMNRTVGFGLAAAAVVAFVLIGSQLLGSPTGGDVGSQPTATAESSVAEPSPESSADEPTGAPQGILPGGPFLIWDPASWPPPWNDGPPITVTIPRNDMLHQWKSAPEFAAIGWTEGSDPPDGAGMIVFSTASDVYAYGDPCQWSTTRMDTPATTVDELVAALAAQPSRGDSEPRDVTVGGYDGKSIRLHVPDDAETREEAFADCDQNMYASFEVDGDTGPARYHQGPGQIDELWVLDVDGAFVIIDAMYGPETNPDLVDDLRAIAESATFELP